jgi:hypothetical protein
MRQGDLHDLRAQFRQLIDGRAHTRFDLGWMPSMKYSFGTPTAPLDLRVGTQPASSRGRSIEVASRGSAPAIKRKIVSTSSALCASTPTVSSEEP